MLKIFSGLPINRKRPQHFETALIISGELYLNVSFSMIKKPAFRLKREEEMKILNSRKNIDKRMKLRQPYSGHIFFSVKNRFAEGRLKDYSRSGLFIESEVSVSVGDIITIALPYLNGKHTKCRGQIMWCNKEGFGIELFKKRSAKTLKIIK